MHVLVLVVQVLELNVEHLREVLSKVMRSGSLDSTTIGGDVTFDGCGVVASRELLALRLASLDDGNRQQIFVDRAVQLQNVEDFLVGLFLGGERGVSLLPQELSASEEGNRVLELPTNDVRPLVELEGKISVGSDPLSKGWVHDGLASGANGDGFLHFALARSRHPSDFRSKVFDVLLLGGQSLLGHQEREVRVLHSELLDASVEVLLNLFPNGISVGSQDVASRDVVVVEHFGLQDGLSVPVGEVFELGRRDTFLVLSLLL